MPFTPFHMGPGIAFKAVLGGSFSLMVFGWTQIIMDIQPLLVLISGEGHLHGFSHTYLGASLLAVFSAVTGKSLSELGLFLLGMNPKRMLNIPWWVVFLSAFIGAYSHVFLDSIMHADLEPFSPFVQANPFLGLISVEALHMVCIGSGVVGALVFYALYANRKFTARDNEMDGMR